MKRVRITLFALIFAALSILSCSPAAEQLRVVSFNIRMGVADDGENSWDNRKEATIAMIEDIKPDIMGLQEAFGFQSDYIRENCPDYEGVGVGRDDGKEEGERMMIFYNKEKIELLEWGTFCQRLLNLRRSDGMPPAAELPLGH